MRVQYGLDILNISMLKDKLCKLILLLFAAVPFASCDDTVTYSEMKEKERDAVEAYIKEKGINIISFEQFVANDSTTDVSKNEYVLVDDIYMQIENNPIKNDARSRHIYDGENVDLLIRYHEYNIQEDDTITSNWYAAGPDEMSVANTSGSYKASFTSGVMMTVYKTSSVPTGWLVPMRFLTFNRRTNNLATVNIIVPHTKGTSNAATYVYPCLYHITFQPADPQFENNF